MSTYPCKDCICVPMCVNKNIPALLIDCQPIELWILGGPHTDKKGQFKVRNEKIEVLGKKIRVQTNGNKRTLYYDAWTYNVEMSKDYKKYLEVWKETYSKWNQGSVTAC